MHGLVIQTHNRFYRVKLGASQLLCSLKGIRKQAQPAYRLPVIGDRVTIVRAEGANGGIDGYITAIEARRNTLSRNPGNPRRIRVMAANLDLIFIVNAAVRPDLDFGLIDRYILACELADIPFAVVVNKTDLVADRGDPAELDVYRGLGIPVYPCSVKTGEGLADLEASLTRGISLFTGHSGVGKSSLINYFAPEAGLATGSVNDKSGEGKHTTTSSSLIPLGGDGWLADSPGLRDFAPSPVDPEQVRFGFREIVDIQADCRFSTCLHDKEPDCAVRSAVSTGALARFRYRNYMALLWEMRDLHHNRF